MIADLESDGWQLEAPVSGRVHVLLLAKCSPGGVFCVAKAAPAVRCVPTNSRRLPLHPPQVDDCEPHYACLQNPSPKPLEQRRVAEAWAVGECVGARGAAMLVMGVRQGRVHQAAQAAAPCPLPCPVESWERGERKPSAKE